MKINDQHTFLKRRQTFEERYFEKNQNLDNPLKSIVVVDVNTTDVCNRTCVFCPRHKPEIYPNRILHMTPEGANIIASKLKTEADFNGTVAISGFSENLLNPHIVEVIAAFRKHLPDAFIECNTNGDPLSSERFDQLIEAGLDCLNINLYDGPHQVEIFDTMLKGKDTSHYKYRVHWEEEDYGIIFNNRSGMIEWIGNDQDDLDKVKHKPCYYTFYKLFVDWNGDILFCANDWGRTNTIGNLLQQSLEEIWLSTKMKKFRDKLSKGNRDFNPCNKCNVQGDLVGKKSHDILRDHYEKNNRNRIK